MLLLQQEITSTLRKSHKWYVIRILPMHRCADLREQMFVFGEVQDPYPDTVNLVEDIVRGQLIELVCLCFV